MMTLSDKPNMIDLLPIGCCSKCKQQEFIILQVDHTSYIVNKYGEIKNFKDLGSAYIGKCLTCGKEYKMIPYHDHIVPLTTMRSMVIDYTERTSIDHNIIKNPIHKDSISNKSIISNTTNMRNNIEEK